MNNRHDKILFWGCFIALITTSYAFISRMILCGGDQFAREFGIDKVAAGELQGAGVWPFGVSIIVFSLFIDRIGYKIAMVFSFISYLIYVALAFAAYSAVHVAGLSGDALVAAQTHGHKLFYWGSIILGLGNGSVEAYVNPIVATMFSKDKTKWLNRLHAGWPGGLVFGGLCTIALANNADWRLTLGLILIPAFIFFFILITLKFPKSEREQAGISYLQMLKELGAFGALVGFGLVFAQLFQVLIPEAWHWPGWAFWVPTALVVLFFAAVTKSFGRPLLAFLIIIMMPQATTELGTNGWITALMEDPMKAAGYNAAWVLVYTSAIMLVLRFVAGPLIHKFSPPGLLLTCSALAGVGILALSKTAHSGTGAIFAAATVFGIGITFFWPTILGLTSEQCPKGGALSLNTMGGIGMLAVGILGAPFLGYMQEMSTTQKLQATNPALYQQVTVKKNYLLGAYEAIDPTKSAAVADSKAQSDLQAATTAGKFTALGRMAMFPAFTFICYLALIFYFKSKGGYIPVELAREEEKSGVQNPVAA